MLTVFVGPLLLALAAEVPVITPYDARDHVGQDVVVGGQVTQVGASEDARGLFLGFGPPYPYHVFIAVIFNRDLKSFPEVRSLEGKTVKLRGKIRIYQGKPGMILERQEQVTVDSSTEHPDGDGVEAASGATPVMDYDSPPKPVRITRPQYPQEAFVKQIEGTVLVEITIDSSGRVVRARVLQSVPMLDAAALQTVYGWVFQPAIKHGQRVPTIAQAPISFRIDRKKPAAAPVQRE